MTVKKYAIEVVNESTHEVVKTLYATDERMADKVESGVSINLDHDRYFTRIRKLVHD